MRIAGIVCECNPFHGGHAHLIESARRDGVDTVVCLMSGEFVQRGEAAIVDARVRAEALVRGGADLVLELPFPYSAASAEHFAAAGVKMLDRLGATELWFGSECGDLVLLSRLARACDDEAFLSDYCTTVTDACGTAEAYFDCLATFVGEDVSCASNDILAISYLRAISLIGSRIHPVTLRREGSGYREAELGKHEYPSATALRRLWRTEGVDAVLPYLPEATRVAYRDAKIADWKYAERLAIGYLRLTPPEQLERCALLSGGLGRRLSHAAQSARTWEELLSLTATKKYPTARLQRGILFALTGITDADLSTEPAYARLLGANAVGREHLARLRRTDALPVVTRRAELPDTPEAQRQARRSETAHALYTLCRGESEAADGYWRQGAYILTEQKEK
jgi:predicted nucleotidyltransferase